MIFIVLGTQKFQLNRVLKLMDDYIEQGLITDRVFAQVGNSDYVPKNYGYEYFLDKAEFDAWIKKADLIITHSGVGSIISALNAGKAVIVFPRLAKYHEHVDDHQLDIANAFYKKGFVLCCNKDDDLMELIRLSRSYPFKKYHSQREKVIELVKNYVEEII